MLPLCGGMLCVLFGGTRKGKIDDRYFGEKLITNNVRNIPKISQTYLKS